MADEEPIVLEAAEAEETAPEGPKQRLDLSVRITDAGPCKKHVVVTIPRAEIERFFEKEFSELVKTAAVPGFRPGKTPRRLLERRFHKEVAGQVKGALLMQSLEQIGEEEKLEPLSEPKIDLVAIELPEEGDFVYEFDVEVRPRIQLPEYKGLRIQKPVRSFTDEDVQRGLEELQRRHGTSVPKEGGVALGDTIEVDVRFMDGQDVVNEFSGLKLQVDEELDFRDGKIVDFAKQFDGARAGDTRELRAKMSGTAARPELQGKELDAVFVIKEVQELHPASVEDLVVKLDVRNEVDLRDGVLAGLEHRQLFRQQEAARDQVIAKLLVNADWELPQDLLRRVAERTLRRRIMELESYGFSDDEIRAYSAQLRRDSLLSTAKALKQQFVLQEIAEAEGIKVEQNDLEDQVRDIALRTGESPRRVRARVGKEDLWETLTIQILEDKTIRRILGYAQIEDVPDQVEAPRRAFVLDEAAMPEPAPSAADQSSETEAASS